MKGFKLPGRKSSSLPAAVYFDIEGRLVSQARLIGAEVEGGGIADPDSVILFLFDVKVPLRNVRFDGGRNAWVWATQGQVALRLYQQLRTYAFDPARRPAA